MSTFFSLSGTLTARIMRPMLLVPLLLGGAAGSLFGAGSVVPWGDSSSQQGSVPPGLLTVVSVAGGGAHSLALKSDGTVVGWGFNLSGQATPPVGLSNVQAISAGSAYSLALRSNGTVVAWGSSPTPPAGLSNVTAIAAGWYHSLGLRANGTVVGWGPQASPPLGLSNLVAIAAGNGHSLALRADSTVVAWGDEAYGKTLVPEGLTNVIGIAAGADHCLALRLDGSVVAWGRNDAGQTDVPSSLTNAVLLGAGNLHSLALRADGTLAAWGDNTYTQSLVPAQAGFLSVAAGGFHSLAIRGDGSPLILRQPLSQTVVVSKTASFKVTALGALPLSYQWRFNGTNLAGATNLVLVVANAQPTNAGAYSVLVFNGYNSLSSQPALLTVVGDPPRVLSPPQDQTAICGDNPRLQVSLDGASPFSFQWCLQGVPLLGATNSSLLLSNVVPAQAGSYSLWVTNLYGWTSTNLNLFVQVQPPLITSTLAASGRQGGTFRYTISALHTPQSFGAMYLPNGLSLNSTNGLISGIPAESGTFAVIISAFNACSSDTETLTLYLSSSAPAITSALSKSGTEGAPLSYRIVANNTPTSYGAASLPVGLSIDTASGTISGTPLYPGSFVSSIWASNQWGIGSANLRFTIANALLQDLAMANVSYKYGSPYLLDFQFSLFDSADPDVAQPVVVDPHLLSVSCLEGSTNSPVSPSETAVLLAAGSAKVLKVYLVLDFSYSIASLANGDSNDDGISDAVDSMVSGAQTFVNQQSAAAQIGVFEFHRDDRAPAQVVGLTTDKALLNSSIAGIWTNYVQWFPAGSRCWDALSSAIGALGAPNADEEHYVVFLSDGQDESSIRTATEVINAAVTNSVKIYCIGFGDEVDTSTLTNICQRTGGKYYPSTNVNDLVDNFAHISKALNGQYILRWASLKRNAKAFMPSFKVSYQGLTAASPTNPWSVVITTDPGPPEVSTTNNVTNFIIDYFNPSQHTGDVTVGALRLLPNAEVRPSGITLRATYIPRYVRQLQLHYQANWPCTPLLQSTNSGDLFYGWSMSQTNDGASGYWLSLSSPYPQSYTNGLLFGGFGNIVTFAFQDVLNSSNAFGSFSIDNSVYTNTGFQSFVLDGSTSSFIQSFPTLPMGTPVPWLMAHGFSGNFTNSEVADSDMDGLLNWQEYQANTDPNDPASRFATGSVSRLPNGRFQVSFNSSLNRHYQVLASTDLLTWDVVQDAISGTGADITVTDTRPVGGIETIFYRVRVY